MEALELFLSSIRSPHTKKAYDGYFKKYQEFVGKMKTFFAEITLDELKKK
jgi:hypothetical protein